MRLLTLTLLAFLIGCGTVQPDNRTSYFMVSKGNASGVVKLFGGGVDFCKVTQSNLEGVNFVGEIKYDGENCTIEVAADKNPGSDL